MPNALYLSINIHFIPLCHTHVSAVMTATLIKILYTARDLNKMWGQLPWFSTFLTSVFLTKCVSVEECEQVFTAIPVGFLQSFVPSSEGLQIFFQAWQDYIYLCGT